MQFILNSSASLQPVMHVRCVKSIQVPPSLFYVSSVKCFSQKCDSNDNKHQSFTQAKFLCLYAFKEVMFVITWQELNLSNCVCLFYSEQNLSTKKAENVLHSVSQQNRNFYGKNFNLYKE